MRRATVFGLVVVGLLAASLLALGMGALAHSGGAHKRVRMHFNELHRAEITVCAGDWVKWVSQDYEVHNVHSSLYSPEPFQSPDLMRHDSYERQFNTVGDHYYQCDYHAATMQGIVHVMGC